MSIKNKIKVTDPEATVIKDTTGNDVGIKYDKLPTWLSSTPKTSRDQSTINTNTNGADTLAKQKSVKKVTLENNATAPTETMSSENDYINTIADLQKIAKQSEYENAYKKVMSQIEEARAKTNAEYKAKMNDSDVSSQLQQKNYFENVANRGQTNSGSTSQGELALKIAGMNNQSALRTGQAQAMADLNRDAYNAYSDYVNNVAQSNANIDIQRYQNLLEQYRIDQENLRQEQKERLQHEIATIAQYEGDFDAAIAREEAKDPNSIMLSYLRNAKVEGEKKLKEKLEETLKEAKEEQEKQAKLLMQLKDYDALDALGYNTSLLRKESALDMARTQSLINSSNSSGSGKSKNNYSNVLKGVQGYLENNGTDYEENIAGAKYLVGELNVDNIDATEMVNIMRQTNMPIAVMARALKNYNTTDEEIAEFVRGYFGNEISDDYLQKILDYANK